MHIASHEDWRPAFDTFMRGLVPSLQEVIDMIERDRDERSLVLAQPDHPADRNRPLLVGL